MEIEHIRNKRFVMSYSCGKDSTLALHKMIQQGNKPIALIVMINKDVDRSFFHGVDHAMLEKYSKALDIPMILACTAGEDYHIEMENALRKAKEMGAEFACFGDIDIEGNRAWSEQRCQNAGLPSVFPLWQNNRNETVYELIALGYKCLIKSIHNRLLPKSLLGKTMDADTVSIMEEHGIDVCGENGEYHTLVVDGPIFRTPVAHKIGKILDFGAFSVIEVQ